MYQAQDPQMLDQLSKNITRCGLSNSTLNYLRVSEPHTLSSRTLMLIDWSFFLFCAQFKELTTGFKLWLKVYFDSPNISSNTWMQCSQQNYHFISSNRRISSIYQTLVVNDDTWSMGASQMIYHCVIFIFLQLCVILEPMQELMSRHKTYSLSPRDCLKTCLFQKWQRMVAPPGRWTARTAVGRQSLRHAVSVLVTVLPRPLFCSWTIETAPQQTAEAQDVRWQHHQWRRRN